MKLLDLYTRIVETTGLETITIDNLRAAVANCMADLTSRGYKTFVSMNTKDFEELGEIKCNQNLIELPYPEDVRKVLYLRLFFPEGAIVATRYGLSNKRVGCKFINGAFRSMIEPGQAIFYIKGNKLFIEWHTACGEQLVDFEFGYYQKLSLPEGFPTQEEFDVQNNTEALASYDIPIRKEFEDAVVFYAAYFYYSRFQKDTDKINLYLSQYKYYVEDITHELSYEDDFQEEDAVIKTEEDL